MRLASILSLASLAVSSVSAGVVDTSKAASAAADAEVPFLERDADVIKRTWISLQAAYGDIHTKWDNITSLIPRYRDQVPLGLYGSGGTIPSASSRIIGIYTDTNDKFRRMPQMGALEATALFFPANELLREIRTLMRSIQTAGNSVRRTGDQRNVRTMLDDQQRSFQTWARSLLRVLPAWSGQAFTGEQFIREVNQAYDGAIRAMG